MRALIVYESMFGATRRIAEAIAEGTGLGGGAVVVRASTVHSEQVLTNDLLVVGAPTHVHALPRPMTRKGSPDAVSKSNGALTLEPRADVDPGVREWLEMLGTCHGPAAAFDTRLAMHPLMTGRASRGIYRRLRNLGCTMVMPAQSFLVDKHNQLLAGELERARRWGEQLASAAARKQSHVGTQR